MCTRKELVLSNVRNVIEEDLKILSIRFGRFFEIELMEWVWIS